MLNQESKKLKKAFFFWSYFDPYSFHHFKNFQQKTQIKVTLRLKIKYFKKFSINSTGRLLNNNQHAKQKELFLLKQFLTNLNMQKNSTKHLDFYNLMKTEVLSTKEEKSKYLQSFCCLEDFLSV